jgi:hypothetical protein
LKARLFAGDGAGAGRLLVNAAAAWQAMLADNITLSGGAPGAYLLTSVRNFLLVGFCRQTVFRHGVPVTISALNR